jgi:hypothetical protein
MRYAICLAAGIATLMLTAAANASGPYDGTYAGTSLTFKGTTSSSGKGNACQTTATAPAPLTISNGHAQTKWADSTMQGDVGPNGALVMHSALSGRFEGQIDASGAVRGNYEGYCIYALSWQRRG